MDGVAMEGLQEASSEALLLLPTILPFYTVFVPGNLSDC